MITEAVIAAIGVILAMLLLRAKEIYEIWVQWSSTLRKDEHQHESTVVTELKGHIQRLKRDGDDLRASVAYLNHEQLECSVEEERLWGALNLIYHHVVKQNTELLKLGAKPDVIPPLPARRQRQRMTAEEFFRRTASMSARLEEETNNPTSSTNLNNLSTQSSPTPNAQASPSKSTIIPPLQPPSPKPGGQP